MRWMAFCARYWIPVFGMLAIGAQQAGAASTTDFNALYSQARQAGETQVVVYTPYGNLQPVWDAFAKRFNGLTVQTAVISGGGAPLLARVRAERNSAQHIGDLVLSGLGDINVLIHENSLERDVPAETATLPSGFVDPSGLFQVPFNTLFTIVYNPALIQEKDLPRSLDEAIGAKWSGKFGYTRYTGAAAPDLVGTVLSYNNAISDQQLRQIKTNGQVSPTAVMLLGNVAQGRVVFGLWGPTQNVKALQDDGAPIKVHLLTDSAVIFGPGLSLLKDAPHPHAARLLKAWLYSQEGQAALTRSASVYGTQPNAPIPPGLPSLGSYHFKPVPLPDFEATLAAFRKRAIAVFGQ